MARELGRQWKELSVGGRERYDEEAKQDRQRYEGEMVQYKAALNKYKLSHPDLAPSKKPKKLVPLFNKVVQIDGHPNKYFYVLTFLPDLQWCHCVPLEQRGVFEANKGDYAGQPKWMLAPEGSCVQTDCSAHVCTVIRVKLMKKSDDADKEEWAISQ